MFVLFATAAMTLSVAAAPAIDARPHIVSASLLAPAPACKANGRYEVADPALLYRDDARARLAPLGELPKANHEKAVLRSVDGCVAPVVVGHEVGR